MNEVALKNWVDCVVKEEEINRYLEAGRDFIDDSSIEDLLDITRNPEKAVIRNIIRKSLSLHRLDPEETASLLNVEDEETWQEIFEAAGEIKNRVYGSRVVTFAPLYLSNLCVNSCVYCAFRCENDQEKRRMLTIEEVRRETKALISIGHKRLVVVYGEHPETDINYMADTINTIYDVKLEKGEIRRVNINAPPLSVSDYGVLRDIGIGTYQVFQETYSHKIYAKLHPRGPKSNYRWRLYALHRAQEAGVDDVAIGALFGLYDWRFEVIGLLLHTIDLEKKFDGVGPHTISFPRLEPAANTPFTTNSPYMVSDRDFKRLIAVIRLSVPYTGMIITARESAGIRHEAMKLGCTQTDASPKIGIGTYSENYESQEAERQQFLLGDTRSLDEVIRELAEMGLLTSFCTAGYRCGRTGRYFMDIAKTGKVHQFCIPNAIITFKEYLLDFASDETRKAGERLIEQRLNDAPESIRPILRKRLKEVENGARDLRF